MNPVKKTMWHLMALLCLLTVLPGCGKKMVRENVGSDQYAQSGDRVKSYGRMNSHSTIMQDGLGDGERLQLGESTITSSVNESNQHLGKVKGGNPGSGQSTVSSSSANAFKPGHDGSKSYGEDSPEVVTDSLDTIGLHDSRGIGETVLNGAVEGYSPSQKGVTFSHNLRDVHFDFDSWRLGDQARDILEANAEWLKAHPHEHVTIEGHCDERGTQSYNYVLGEKRAAMVQQYLTFLGVPLDQLYVASFGKDRPACRTMSADCFEQNRRAHFKADVNMVSQQSYSITP